MAQSTAKDPYKYFRPEAREILEQFSRGVLDLEKGESDASTVQRLLRLAHTLKGAARVVKQSEIANRAHAIEDVLAPLRNTTDKVGREQIEAVIAHIDTINNQLALLAPTADVPAANATAVNAKASGTIEETSRTIRTELAEADAVLDSVVETHALMNGLREAARNVQDVAQLAETLASQFSAYSSRDNDRRSDSRSSQRFAIVEDLRRKAGAVERSLGSVVDQMDRELRQLREAAERLRLIPASSLFTVLERTARDMARAQSKQVAFTGIGGEIRLDAHVLDVVQGALVQLVRNAVAHGIEPEAGRTATKKQQVGSVTVAVCRRDRKIVFSCGDDGRGVDLDEVRRVAAQRGVLETATGELGPDALMRMLLRGGLSTSKTVTEEAGRGIGLDVVREAVERLGGEVACRSQLGTGTTFEIVIPPSLSSMDALIVEVAENAGTVAVPLDCVRRTRRLASSEVTFASPGASVLFDGEAIPFVPLAAALQATAWSSERNWPAVVVAGAGGLAAIGVERLLGTVKIVVRPLPEHMTASPMVAAAALDADGNPQLVLDPDSLVSAARRGCNSERDAGPAKLPVLVVDDSLTTRMLEQSILESAGYEVDLAVSGEQALECVRARAYALILVDVEMPGMDGFTLIERLRSDAKSRDIPAILVTSLAEPEHRKRGREVGAQGYIVKSEFNQAELLSMIKPMMAA
jgi:two-component system, chemotaxis family, sensor kinase CheA